MPSGKYDRSKAAPWGTRTGTLRATREDLAGWMRAGVEAEIRETYAHLAKLEKQLERMNRPKRTYKLGPQSDEHREAISRGKQRAKQAKADHMRERWRKQKEKERRKKGVPKKSRLKDWKTKWYARLQAHGPERIRDSANALGATAASLITSGKRYLDSGAIEKVGKGTYKAGPESKIPAEK